MRVVNKDRIIEAYIREPYENSGEQWDYGHSHGWQVILVVGFLSEGQERQITIEKESKEECVYLINSFGFVSV
jgi:hypothetical protein